MESAAHNLNNFSLLPSTVLHTKIVEEVGMHSRLIITLFLCGWMAAFPMRIGAGGGGPKQPRLDLMPAMGSTIDPNQPAGFTATPPRLHPTTRAERRRQTARQRANAIAHVKRSRWIPNITYAQIQEIYDAKKIALAKVVADGSYRRTLIAQAKTRALAEVKAMVAVLRDRQAAEMQALALAEAALHAANPNYNEDALRKAMAETQVEGGERVSAVEGLPVLSNALAMNYPKANPTVMAKQTPELPEQPKQAAQLKALRDFKKLQALKQVKQARQEASLKQQKISHREMEQRLQALLDQFAANKITTGEYYERREQIYRDGGVK
jgi:hypothetical protein